MKRARIMLVAIAVFATVGAALAFNANKLGQQKYCYVIDDTPPPPGECTSFTSFSSMTTDPGTDIWYTVTNTTDPLKCTLVTECPNLAHDILQ